LKQAVEKNISAEIFYVQDALCGWCYGLQPVIEQIKTHYNESIIAFTPIHGGLWPGVRARKMDQSLVSHLHNGMPMVTQHTGQIFGDDFKNNIVNNPQFIYDTEPAARAAIILRNYSPNQELNFIKDIQIAFFVYGLDPTKLETFLPIVTQYGIDVEDFKQKYNSKQAIDDTKKDFSRSLSWGVSAFPSLLLQSNGSINMISSGSCSLSHVINVVDRVLVNSD